MQKIIFEGAELAGKSWIMSQIYNYLEPKYNQNMGLLDGCHWFNCDNGVFGSSAGKQVLDGYLSIFSALKNKNIIAEKFHITDKLYCENKGLYQNYEYIEKILNIQGFKIILITMPNDIDLVKARLNDRLNLYPHYKKIMHSPEWYLEMQAKYVEEINNSALPSLIIDTHTLPNDEPITKIINWLNQNNEK